MKFVPASATRLVGSTVLKAQKNSPALLFGAGVVGVVATTVLACRATLQVEDILIEAQKDLANVDEIQHNAERSDSRYAHRDVRKDKAYIYLRTSRDLVGLYAPSVICGVLSIAALTKSHNLLSKRNAALTAAYAALEKSFDGYRDRVRGEVGYEREEEIYHDVLPCEIEDPDTGKKTKKKVASGRGGSIYARFFDRNSSSWEPVPEYNVAYLRAQQAYWNDRLQSKGHVFLNEVYDALGLERSKEGAVVGWVRGNGDSYIDFGCFSNPDAQAFLDFVTGREGGIWLDFNVDGTIFDKI